MGLSFSVTLCQIVLSTNAKCKSGCKLSRQNDLTGVTCLRTGFLGVFQAGTGGRELTLIKCLHILHHLLFTRDPWSDFYIYREYLESGNVTAKRVNLPQVLMGRILYCRDQVRNKEDRTDMPDKMGKIRQAVTSCLTSEVSY